MKNKPFIHLLETPLHKYAYDVNTNQIIRLTDDLYDYFKNHSSSEPSENIKRQIDELNKKGYLLSKHIKKIRHPETDFLKYHLDKNICQLTLQVTQQCNFRCSYCPYTTAEFDNQREHGSRMMSLEVAKKAVDFYIEHSTNRNKAIIGFYGGEPLLKFSLIKDIVEYAEKKFLGKDIMYTITTNGSLFTREILDFFREYEFNIMVSLDGPPEIHNRSRKFASSGMGTFEAIEKNFNLMKDEYPDLLSNMSVNVVIDPRYSSDGIHELFSNSDLFRNIRIQTTLIDDFFSIERVVPDDSFLIADGIQRFKALASYIGMYPENKVSRVAKNELQIVMHGKNTELEADKCLADVMAPSGPCVPGQRRLFVDVNGNLFPCERVSETSDAMLIGTLDDGFYYYKAERILNIGQLTEEKCKNCFAVRKCSLCAKYCDNNGELSAELKSSNCRNVRARVISDLKDYLFKKEFEHLREISVSRCK